VGDEIDEARRDQDDEQWPALRVALPEQQDQSRESQQGQAGGEGDPERDSAQGLAPDPVRREPEQPGARRR